jgi:pyruvate,water dikinase
MTATTLQRSTVGWIEIRDPSGAASSPAQVGGKAATLARLAAAGLPVPPGWVATPELLRAQLTDAAWQALTTVQDAAQAAAILATVTLPDDFGAHLAGWLEGSAGTFAVRSSALDEDGAAHSFAGQLQSFLHVPHDTVAQRVVDVWRSGFTPQLFAYRRARGLAGAPTVPAVLIQPMVDAQAAGVAFSADPVQGRRTVAVVSAVRGLADGLVGGEQTGESWTVARDGSITALPVDDGATPVLARETVAAVAELARTCADLLGAPQDIEWAWDGTTLHLLQARPITTLGGLPDPDGGLTLWDNSNIIESYGGMTTPLTYSFARRAYQAVYQELCRILGVDRATIQAHQSVFANMIGLIGGRIYYNLLNWYRVLALLPGFKANRHFMEQMMGVKESLPPEIIAQLAQSSWRDRLADRLRLARTGVGLGLAFGTQGRRERRFYARLDKALGERLPDLRRWRADELVAYYRRLESDLLPRWDAPLVNDFFAMIFFGLLRGLVGKWGGETDGALHNDLLTGQGGMISAEPAARVRALAQLAQRAETQQPGFLAALAAAEPAWIAALPDRFPEFAAAYHAYLARFGERCLAELKLESATLVDDPRPLLHAVAQLAQHPLSEPSAGPPPARTAAEAHMAQQLAGKPLRRALFRWVLHHARRHVVARENLRFARTRVFGRARQILRALGVRLAAAGALNQANDVFYLTVEEVCGWVEGTTVGVNLAGLVELRRQEFDAWALQPPLPARFATWGALYEGNRFAAEGHAPPLPEGDQLVGLGAAPGRVSGRVRRVRDPLTAQLAPGDIIVAEHTDPSWILVLPLAGGLVVERGSLLSHAAIVARELGIPAVVAAAGALEWLTEGELVEVDGGAGTVTRRPPTPG